MKRFLLVEDDLSLINGLSYAVKKHEAINKTARMTEKWKKGQLFLSAS